jgi:hypothetical protein
MNSILSATARFVSDRAAGRCEYCLMHQTLQGATFHIEHIIPRSAGGTGHDSNLCLACPSCNLQKSSRISFLDVTTTEVMRLFHPRMDSWAENFEWSGFFMIGLTAIGRATIDALRLNAPRRLLIREAEGKFGLFPP